MTRVHRSFSVLLLSVSLLSLMPGRSAAQASAPPAPAQAAQTQPAPAAPADAQAYNLPPEKLAKAIALNRIRHILSFTGSLWGLAVLWILLATRFFAWMAAGCERLIKWHWLSGLLFFALFFLVTTLASLPLDIYGEHVERAYGISVQGWGGWAGDQAKALALVVPIGSLVLLLFNWIARKWPRRYWLGLWIVTVPLLLLTMIVSPLLEPIFNKYEPLSQNNAALVTELQKVVVRTGTNIPPERMFLMKASLKSNGLNAYVSGMGATKRIVVWDTTAGRIPNDEVQFIFGHESGHYVLNHIPKQFATSVVFMFFLYWGCAAFTGWLIRRFGASWRADSVASRTGFLALMFTLSVASFLLQPASSALSRHYEHEADVYGQESIHGLVADPQKTAVASFNALGEAWLEDPNPNPFIEFWSYSHPSVQSRANFAAHYDPWANGGHGKFFDK